MKEQEQKMKLPKLDDLFSDQAQRDYEKAEKVEEIDISKIADFPNHPFKVEYTILQDLDEEEYNKIPHQVIETIEANRNKEYEYFLDDELELKDQPMLPETKAILFNLFRDYLATPE